MPTRNRRKPTNTPAPTASKKSIIESHDIDVACHSPLFINELYNTITNQDIDINLLTTNLKTVGREKQESASTDIILTVLANRLCANLQTDKETTDHLTEQLLSFDKLYETLAAMHYHERLLIPPKALYTFQYGSSKEDKRTLIQAYTAAVVAIAAKFLIASTAINMLQILPSATIPILEQTEYILALLCPLVTVSASALSLTLAATFASTLGIIILSASLKRHLLAVMLSMTVAVCSKYYGGTAEEYRQKGSRQSNAIATCILVWRLSYNTIRSKLRAYDKSIFHANVIAACHHCFIAGTGFISESRQQFIKNSTPVLNQLFRIACADKVKYNRNAITQSLPTSTKWLQDNTYLLRAHSLDFMPALDYIMSPVVIEPINGNQFSNTQTDAAIDLITFLIEQKKPRDIYYFLLRQQPCFKQSHVFKSLKAIIIDNLTVSNSDDDTRLIQYLLTADIETEPCQFTVTLPKALEQTLKTLGITVGNSNVTSLTAQELQSRFQECNENDALTGKTYNAVCNHLFNQVAIDDETAVMSAKISKELLCKINTRLKQEQEHHQRTTDVHLQLCLEQINKLKNDLSQTLTHPNDHTLIKLYKRKAEIGKTLLSAIERQQALSIQPPQTETKTLSTTDLQAAIEKLQTNQKLHSQRSHEAKALLAALHAQTEQLQILTENHLHPPSVHTVLPTSSPQDLLKRISEQLSADQRYIAQLQTTNAGQHTPPTLTKKPQKSTATHDNPTPTVKTEPSSTLRTSAATSPPKSLLLTATPPKKKVTSHPSTPQRQALSPASEKTRQLHQRFSEAVTKLQAVLTSACTCEASTHPMLKFALIALLTESLAQSLQVMPSRYKHFQEDVFRPLRTQLAHRGSFALSTTELTALSAHVLYFYNACYDRVNVTPAIDFQALGFAYSAPDPLIFTFSMLSCYIKLNQYCTETTFNDAIISDMQNNMNAFIAYNLLQLQTSADTLSETDEYACIGFLLCIGEFVRESTCRDTLHASLKPLVGPAIQIRRKYAHGKMATDEARKCLQQSCLQQIIKERELLAHMAKNWDTKKRSIDNYFLTGPKD